MANSNAHARVRDANLNECGIEQLLSPPGALGESLCLCRVELGTHATQLSALAAIIASAAGALRHAFGSKLVDDALSLCNRW